MQPDAIVFLVDDDEAVRNSIVLLLEAEGFRVAAFASAQAFLDHYQPDQPGCLVLDVSMPDITGLQLQQILLERQISIPLIFISGHGDVPMSVKAIRAGAIDFIEKPFNEDILINRIREAIALDLSIREAEARKQVNAIHNYAESMVETIRIPLLVLDEELHVLSANRSFYQTFRLSPPSEETPDVSGHIESVLWSIPQLKAHMQALVADKTDLRDLELQQDIVALGRKIFKCNACELWQPHYQSRRFLLAMEDITQRKFTEEELKRHKEHLEELVTQRTQDLQVSNRELESYSYSIAHDLRSPLRAIVSFSQILKEDIGSKLPENDREHLERVIGAGKKMSELIDDILELSRITRKDLHTSTVDLSQLAQGVLGRLKLSHPDRTVNCQVQDQLIVNGDESLLECVLQNLLENAWKFTQDVTPAVIQVGRVEGSDEPTYFVKDNGIGFDEQYMEKLFQPFHRLHSAEKFEGTGVGLATVKRIIQRHGGRVWASTEQDQGATFYFSLPSKQP